MTDTLFFLSKIVGATEDSSVVGDDGGGWRIEKGGDAETGDSVMENESDSGSCLTSACERLEVRVRVRVRD